MSFVIVFFVVVYPLFLRKPTTYFTNTQAHSFDDSLSILEIITELEEDYHSGKISKEDFEVLSAEFKREYLHIKGKK